MSYLGSPGVGSVMRWDGTKWVPVSSSTLGPVGNNASHRRVLSTGGLHWSGVPEDTGLDDTNDANLTRPDPAQASSQAVYDPTHGYVWVSASSQMRRYTPDGFGSALTQANGSTTGGSQFISATGFASSVNISTITRGELWGTISFTAQSVRRFEADDETTMGDFLGSFGVPAGIPRFMIPDDAGFVWLALDNAQLVKITAAAPASQTTVALPAGADVRSIVFAQGFLWCVDSDQDELYKVDPVGNTVESTISLPSTFSTVRSIAFDGQYLWCSGLVGSDAGLYRVDPVTEDVTGFNFAHASATSGAIAWDGRFLWVANGRSSADDYVSVIDPDSLKEIKTYNLGNSANPSRMVLAGKHLWITGSITTIIPIDWHESMRVRELSVGTNHEFGAVLANHHGPARVQAGQATIDLTNAGLSNYIVRADEAARRLISLIGTPAGVRTLRFPDSIHAGRMFNGAMWIVHNECGQTVTLESFGGTASVSILDGEIKIVYKSIDETGIVEGMHEAGGGGGGGAVSSVFTRSGAVVAVASDYDASLVDNDSTVAGAFVDDALNNLLGSEISPPQLTANVNDYVPTGFNDATHVRLSSDASRTITGFVAASVTQKRKVLLNVGSNDIVLAHLDGGSAAANQIRVAGASSQTLAADESVTIYYDSTTTKWRLV